MKEKIPEHLEPNVSLNENFPTDLVSLRNSLDSIRLRLQSIKQSLESGQ